MESFTLTKENKVSKEKIVVIGDIHSSAPVEIELPRGITTLVLDGDVIEGELLSSVVKGSLKTDLQSLRKDIKALKKIASKIPFHSVTIKD